MQEICLPLSIASKIDHDLYDSPAEKHEPIQIIGIIESALLIEAGAVEVRSITNCPHSDACSMSGNRNDVLFNGGLNDTVRCSDREVCDRTKCSAGFVHTSISRQQQNDVMAELGELLRKSSRHICKASCFRIGH